VIEGSVLGIVFVFIPLFIQTVKLKQLFFDPFHQTLGVIGQTDYFVPRGTDLMDVDVIAGKALDVDQRFVHSDPLRGEDALPLFDLVLHFTPLSVQIE